MPIFVGPSNFALTNAVMSFFSQILLYIALWSEKNLRTNDWIPIFVVIPNFSLDVLYEYGSKLHYCSILHIQKCSRRKYKTLFFTKFNGIVRNIDNCNMYPPNSLSMFYEENYRKVHGTVQ